MKIDISYLYLTEGYLFFYSLQVEEMRKERRNREEFIKKLKELKNPQLSTGSYAEIVKLFFMLLAEVPQLI